MGTIEVTFPSDGPPGRLLKWRVRLDTMVSAGRVLFLYNHVTPESDDTKNPEKKYRATRFGRVTKFLVKEGAVVQPGQAVMLLEGCKHSTVMKDLCAECGIDLRLESATNDTEAPQVSQASVPMVHSIPELKVCPELAEKIGKEDEERLLKDRKLALLVDLDQTLVHTTNDNIPPNMKDVFHYQLYGPNSPWYHTRLRPNTRHFLAEMSQLYELHICTFGARNYAHTVAALLDTDGTLFSHRILSRDECFDPASKTANLKALFPCGDDLVCIIDDREDVWQGCGNLVQVKPYHFFRHTGDIHAPPGMEKTDLPNLGESQDYIESDMEKPVSEENKNGVENTIEESSIVNEISEEKERAENESLPMLDNETSSVIENTTASPNLEKKSSSEDEKVTESNQSDAKTNDEATSTVDSSENNNNVESNTTTENDSEIVEKAAESGVDAQPEDVKGEELKSEKSKLIDKDDDDDYLLYLEDILRRVHVEFYTELDKEGKRRPLREIIPRVRAQVLKGVHITFSGLIPTHQKLHQSRAYKVARAFGAEVSQDLTEKTTHLVAIKPGTAKANAAKRNPNIKIVNPNWLWSCAERWEYVDERLFPLTSKGRASRIPPPHCSSPDRLETEEQIEDRFADSINPLMSFTPEEIEIMDKEVEEDMEDQEIEPPIFDMEDIEEPDNYLEECEADEPDSKKRKLSNESSEDESSSENENNCDDDEEDDPVTRFRRGEDLPDDLDLGDNSQDSIEDLEAVDTEDDREWNAMGAALEREFLSE